MKLILFLTFEMFYLHKDLHAKLADRLDVLTLLKSWRTLDLKLSQKYWKNRVADLCCIGNLKTWQVSDWRQALFEVTYISDFHKLTLVIARMKDFLIREFSVYQLSILKNIECCGYFGLWKQIHFFLSCPEIPKCNNGYHDNEICLCGFHRYLSENKNKLKGFIALYMQMCLSQTKQPNIYFKENQISLTENSSNLYFQMIYSKVSQNTDVTDIKIQHAQSKNTQVYHFSLVS